MILIKKKKKFDYNELKIIRILATARPRIARNLRTFREHHAHQIPLYNLPTINDGHTDARVSHRKSFKISAGATQ